MELSATHRDVLLTLARQSIYTTLTTGQKLPINLDDFPPEVKTTLSSFVTLHRRGELRGCIGSLQAREALALDVARHAHAAAFEDPRFPPVTMKEFDGIHIEISVLSPQQALECGSEEELLARLRTGEDGLTLEDGLYRSTFLPSVWQQLPDKKDFVRQLKRKAGMPDDYWSTSLRVFRYSTTSFAEKK